MESKPIKLYPFNQSVIALEAFVANFSAKVNEIKEDIPVFVLNTGDETYFFEKKFVPKKNSKKYENQDINNIVPRIVLDFSDSPTFQQEQNTNQYNPYKYRFNNRLYLAKNSRRLAYDIPCNCSIITSNFIKALEYFDMIASIVAMDKVLTYEFLGNTFEGNYKITSFMFEKNSIEAGSSTRNFIIKVNIEYSVQLWAVNYSSIVDITDSEGNPDGNYGDNNYEFVIVPTEPDGTQTEHKLKIPDECS